MANTSSDLAQLEYEFATNPNSEAFIPLAEAYLGMGRFVEAMVVCKKGIKAHPELPTGRLIMARIYADQAKHNKAIEELNNLLKLSADNADAHLLLGKINLKLGKEDLGVEHLKKSLDFNPELTESRESLLKIGIDYTPRAAQPEPEPAPVQQAVEQPAATPTGQPPQQQIADRPTERDIHVIERITQPGEPGAVSPSEVQTQSSMPAAPAVQRRPPAPKKKRIADIYQEMEERNAKPERKSLKYSLYLGGVLVVVLIIYVIYTWQAGLKQEEINDHLKKGHNLFNSDSYANYMKALDHYRAIYKLDKNHLDALARGAFICAVVPGEFGGQRELYQEGQKYLAQAMASEVSNSLLVAARALMQLYAWGATNEARKILETALEQNPGSAILHTALGYVLLKRGDLNEARDHLMEGAKQSEIRALVGLGLYAMQRSMYREATQAFNRALQSDRGHVKSILNMGVLALLWGDTPGRRKVARDMLGKFKGEFEKDASEIEKAQAKLIDVVLKVRDRKTRRAGLKALKEHIKKNSGNALFQLVGAREFRRRGKLKLAKETIERALRLDSSRPDFALEEAAIYLAMKDYEGTRSRAMRVQEMDAESGRSSLLIGDAYLGEKKFDKAKEYYHDATKFEDTEAISHMKLGDALMAQPKPDADRAQAQYELAVPGLITSGEGSLASDVCVKLAKIYASKNRHKEFISVLKKAMQADKNNPVPYCLLARNISLDSADGRSQAKEYCENCVKLDTTGEYSGFCKDLLKKM